MALVGFMLRGLLAPTEVEEEANAMAMPEEVGAVIICCVVLVGFPKP